MNRCKATIKMHRVRQAIVQTRLKHRGPLFNDTDWAECQATADKFIKMCRSGARPFKRALRSMAWAIGA